MAHLRLCLLSTQWRFARGPVKSHCAKTRRSIVGCSTYDGSFHASCCLAKEADENTDVKEQTRLEQQAGLLNSPLDNAKAGIELTSLSLSCLGCHCCVQDSLALGQGLFRLAPSWTLRQKMCKSNTVQVLYDAM